MATSKPETVDSEIYDILTYFQLKPSSSSSGIYRIEFSDSKDFKKKNNKSERVNTDESNESYEAKEQPYIVVNKLKDMEGKQTGCKLGNRKHNIAVGQIVKLGRV